MWYIRNVIYVDDIGTALYQRIMNHLSSVRNEKEGCITERDDFQGAGMETVK